MLFLLALPFVKTASATSTTNEFWISPATNFDAIMNNLPANATIHLAAGSYETTGCLGWGPKTGQTIIGAGINLTTLHSPTNPSTNCKWLIEPSSPYYQTNITVSDLTLDCNYQPGTLVTLDGICLHGSNNTIERVRLINAASFTDSELLYSESFGIFITGYPYPAATNNVVKDCIVSNYFCNYWNNLSAIGISSDGGQILNNEVVEDGRNYILAIGCIGKACLISNNITRGCKIGFHADTAGGTTNLSVNSNQFLDCACAFYVANSINYNLDFSSNNIVLSNDDRSYSTEGMCLCPSAAFTNAVVAGNRIRLADTNHFNVLRFILAYDSQGFHIHDNSVDSNLPCLFINSSGIVMTNNYDLAGNPYGVLIPPILLRILAK